MHLSRLSDFMVCMFCPTLIFVGWDVYDVPYCRDMARITTLYVSFSL